MFLLAHQLRVLFCFPVFVVWYWLLFLISILVPWYFLALFSPFPSDSFYVPAWLLMLVVMRRVEFCGFSWGTLVLISVLNRLELRQHPGQSPLWSMDNILFTVLITFDFWVRVAMCTLQFSITKIACAGQAGCAGASFCFALRMGW